MVLWGKDVDELSTFAQPMNRLKHIVHIHKHSPQDIHIVFPPSKSYTVHTKAHRTCREAIARFYAYPHAYCFYCY